MATDDLKLLGVHVFGTNATELVHIRQAVMGCGGTIEYPVDACLPTRHSRRPTKSPRARQFGAELVGGFPPQVHAPAVEADQLGFRCIPSC